MQPISLQRPALVQSRSAEEFLMTDKPDTSTAKSGLRVIRVAPRDLGGVEVRRMLPSPNCRCVGPLVFFDQIGPGVLPTGRGIDVRSHPHIGLATLTYLFDGEILHRDSLGMAQLIRPGEVAWMVAGCGIVHSERTPPALRRTQTRLFGLQVWVALPQAAEETDPSFCHYQAADLPQVDSPGVRIRLVAGDAFGYNGPLPVFSPTLFADVAMAADAALEVAADYEERAVHVADGSIEIAGQIIEAGAMALLTPGESVGVRARSTSRLIIVGGAPPDGPRHLWWNLVSSRKDRIEQAKADWRAGRFPPIPGETEFIPLPDLPGP